MRFLVLILLVVVAVWLVRRALAKASGGAPQARRPVEPGELVGCAHCGVLFPRSEARHAGSLSYCSAEHERLGPRSG